MGTVSWEMASSQPAGRFLVASFLALMAAHSAGVTAAEAGPADAAAVRFIVADGAAGTSVVRAWTKSETKEAATEAEAVIRRAASRIQTALNANDAEFFMGAGSQYVQKEWQLFTAQDVAYVFGVQGAKLKNPWIPSYSTCEHAGQALGDWYHFYRSNLSNGYSLNDLKVMPASRQAERDLWGSLSACKKAL